MKAVVVAAFNQEKALVGASSVIVQPVVEPMDLPHYRERNLLQIDSGKQLIEYLDNFHYFMDLIYNCFDM